MNRKLNLRWTKGQTGQEKENFEKLVRNTKIVLSRLKTILEEDLTELEKISEHDYDTPSWSHKQAHLNGKKEQLRQTLSLFAFLERK